MAAPRAACSGWTGRTSAQSIIAAWRTSSSPSSAVPTALLPRAGALVSNYQTRFSSHLTAPREMDFGRVPRRRAPMGVPRRPPSRHFSHRRLLLDRHRESTMTHDTRHTLRLDRVGARVHGGWPVTGLRKAVTSRRHTSLRICKPPPEIEAAPVSDALVDNTEINRPLTSTTRPAGLWRGGGAGGGARTQSVPVAHGLLVGIGRVRPRAPLRRLFSSAHSLRSLLDKIRSRVCVEIVAPAIYAREELHRRGETTSRAPRGASSRKQWTISTPPSATSSSVLDIDKHRVQQSNSGRLPRAFSMGRRRPRLRNKA